MAGKPLFLQVDALDQLSESHNARSLLWLPVALPENVCLIVSTAPADCWETLKKKTVPAGQIELQPMPASEGGQILDAWLKAAGRTLRKQQRD